MTILLVIIYLAFISLGLPDALLGSAWVVIHKEFSSSIETVGIISMVICGGTILSSLMTSRILRKYETGKVVAVSVAMTAIALFGFSTSNSIGMLIFSSIPLGLGAGAVDAVLNNFVALHYKSWHMNWLHCFWGIGASGGPFILALYLGHQGTWRDGYITIGVIQIMMFLILITSLPLWRKAAIKLKKDNGEKNFISNRAAFKLPGVKIGVLTFLFYCALEAGTGLWAASYLTSQKGVSVTQSVFYVSLYYGSITVGHFLSGILSVRVKGETLIRAGLLVILLGVLMLILPLTSLASLIGLILIGLGCAPIYPTMIHLTPNRFGKKASQSVIGLSMAFAYIGSTFMPPIIGILSSIVSLRILPFALLLLVIAMILSSEYLRMIKHNESKRDTSKAVL